MLMLCLNITLAADYSIAIGSVEKATQLIFSKDFYAVPQRNTVGVTYTQNWNDLIENVEHKNKKLIIKEGLSWIRELDNVPKDAEVIAKTTVCYATYAQAFNLLENKMLEKKKNSVPSEKQLEEFLQKRETEFNYLCAKGNTGHLLRTAMSWGTFGLYRSNLSEIEQNFRKTLLCENLIIAEITFPELTDLKEQIFIEVFQQIDACKLPESWKEVIAEIKKTQQTPKAADNFFATDHLSLPPLEACNNRWFQLPEKKKQQAPNELLLNLEQTTTPQQEFKTDDDKNSQQTIETIELIKQPASELIEPSTTETIGLTKQPASEPIEPSTTETSFFQPTRPKTPKLMIELGALKKTPNRIQYHATIVRRVQRENSNKAMQNNFQDRKERPGTPIPHRLPVQQLSPILSPPSEDFFSNVGSKI